ncbi:MAG: hypothetical protein ACRCT0_01600 [Plesiomonas shigelloides]
MIDLAALIDSGAAGNFMSEEFATANDIPLAECPSPLAVEMATELPHRPNDCCIELQPNTTSPRGRIFPLSQPESEALNKYIEEELKKGFIRHSVSPASSGFFFVKKDGGL